MKLKIFDNRSPTTEQPVELSRGFLFGDGFFTTGIIEKGILRHSQYHFTRLQQSADVLKYTVDPQLIISELAVRLVDVTKACIRITISRQQTSRGYPFNSKMPIEVTVQLSELPAIPEVSCQLSFADTPISSNSLLAGLKHLNRLDSVLASSEIKGANQECLMSDGQSVICGSRSNLFVYDGNQWMTPQLQKAGINGITRQRMIKLMKENGIDIEECHLSRQQVLDCESAFMTNSLLGCWPVAKVVNKLLDTDRCVNLKSQLNFHR